MINVKNIRQLIQSGEGEVKQLILDLGTAITDRRYTIMGTQIALWDTPNQSDQIQIRFNESTKAQIPFKRGKILRAPFVEIYITVPAGLTGNAYLLYGFGDQSILGIRPNIAESSEVIEDIRDELQGDQTPENWGNATIGAVQSQVLAANADRKSWEVQAGLGNTQTIWIGFDNTVTNLNAAKALVAGQSYWLNDYRGAIHAIAGGAGQVLHYAEV